MIDENCEFCNGTGMMYGFDGVDIPCVECSSDYECDPLDTNKLDISGEYVFIGDIVVFNPPRYKGITFGVVESGTPKGIRVWYIEGAAKLCKTVTFGVSKVTYTSNVNELLIEKSKELIRIASDSD